MDLCTFAKTYRRHTEQKHVFLFSRKMTLYTKMHQNILSFVTKRIRWGTIKSI